MAQAASRGKARARNVLGSGHIIGRFANRRYTCVDTFSVVCYPALRWSIALDEY